MIKNIYHYSKRARNCHILCKRPGCYHSTIKTQAIDMIFNLSPVHASVIYHCIRWIRWIHWLSFPFGKTALEFFLNEFHWIQRIQRNNTKSKSGMVTKVITHLLTDTLPVLVIESIFSLQPQGRYLLPVTTRNRYQSTGSRGKFFFTTTSRNVTIVRCRMSLVTILVLDFVTFHWVQWIQRSHLEKLHCAFQVGRV